MYVANFVDSTVSVVDASGCDAPSSGGCRDVPPIATVGAFPSALAVDMASNTVYVAVKADLPVGKPAIEPLPAAPS